MTTYELLAQKIQALPPQVQQEALDFLEYLTTKYSPESDESEAMFLSEKALSDWNHPDEEKAWQEYQ